MLPHRRLRPIDERSSRRARAFPPTESAIHPATHRRPFDGDKRARDGDSQDTARVKVSPWRPMRGGRADGDGAERWGAFGADNGEALGVASQPDVRQHRVCRRCVSNRPERRVGDAGDSTRASSDGYGAIEL